MEGGLHFRYILDTFVEENGDRQAGNATVKSSFTPPKTSLVTLSFSKSKSWTLCEGSPVTGEPATVHSRRHVYTHFGDFEINKSLDHTPSRACSFPRGKITMFKMKV